MAGRAAAALLACLTLATAGCRQEDEPLAAGCREGPEAIRDALRAAPAPVRLQGTPLSRCLADTNDAGDVQELGASYLHAATGLADDAERRPEGEAALQLGYLLGALERGRSGAQGIGYELERRLRAEAARVERSAAFRRGRRAGRADG